MKVHKAYKTELDPNDVQKMKLSQHAGVARFVWNWALSRRIEEYEQTGKSSTWVDQNRQLNEAKQGELSWMYEVSSKVPTQTLRNLDQAFKNFFAKRAKHPKFKAKKHGQGVFRLSGHIHVEPTRIKLPKIGWIRLKEHNYTPTDAKINSVTITQKVGRWFVSVQVEEEITVPENQGSAIGLDLGLKSFVVGSDGSSVEAPKPLQKSLKKLQRLSKQHSRKQKGSANRRKSTQRLAKLHYKISCQRADFLHKTSTELAKTKSVIVIEDLGVKDMLQNRRLSRSISDAGWGEFRRQLEYKAVWYGSKVITADRYFPSTKTCSGCGTVKGQMLLSERQYCCEECGLNLDRDLNAAKNLLNFSTAG